MSGKGMERLWWLWAMALAALVLGYLGVWSMMRVLEHRRQVVPDARGCGRGLTLSLICVVKNRADIIEGFLRGMLAFRQTLPDTEIIVVDNHSTDETAAIAERLARGSHQLFILKMAEQPLKVSPAALGTLYARGQMVCCVDLENCQKPLAVIRLLERVFRGQKPGGDTGAITWVDRRDAAGCCDGTP
jgi:cellulose synthase/poly-beta-1,6-N-acetylglucosamine synthase-like glycosyltransferase